MWSCGAREGVFFGCVYQEPGPASGHDGAPDANNNNILFSIIHVPIYTRRRFRSSGMFSFFFIFFFIIIINPMYYFSVNAVRCRRIREIARRARRAARDYSKSGVYKQTGAHAPTRVHTREGDTTTRDVLKRVQFWRLTHRAADSPPPSPPTITSRMDGICNSMEISFYLFIWFLCDSGSD